MCKFEKTNIKWTPENQYYIEFVILDLDTIL